MIEKQSSKFSDVKWTLDGRCGEKLPDGTLSECNPDQNSCCVGPSSKTLGYCSTSSSCAFSLNSIDYSLVRDIRNSKKNCIISNVNGFLKYVCFDESKHQFYHKCTFDKTTSYEIKSGVSNVLDMNIKILVSNVCEKDEFSYQACGFSTKVTNTDVLCGAYFCDELQWQNHELKHCNKNCQDGKYSCGTDETFTTLTPGTTSSHKYGGSYLRKRSEVCDNNCDSDFCQYESFCNGYHYGLRCPIGSNLWFNTAYVPVQEVCDGLKTTFCSDVNGKDEENCTAFSDDFTTCVHYARKILHNQEIVVPIFNYTRCSVFVLQRYELDPIYPYCADYLDQTNCSDKARVGGHCLINGFRSTVSKYITCDFEILKLQNSENGRGLCHDDLESQCYSPSISTSNSCKVHKHKMCNGVDDCGDSSDENDAMCFHTVPGFSCERWFSPNTSNNFPFKWVKDGTRDCIGADDEIDDHWLICNFKNKSDASVRKRGGNESCNNVFKCPSGTGFVDQEELCDGVESCDTEMKTENNICRIARDFPSLITTVNNDDDGFEYCASLADTNNLPRSCSFQILTGIWMEEQVFGADIQRTGMYLPNSKVECSNLFGEYYAYYSCMDLCLEPNATCPLNDKPLRHDSCRGQFQQRLYTVASSSYITFVRKDGQKFVHENFFQCKNGRCVPHREVCDLIDNCGDLSDEINCTNHIICEDTLKSVNKHIISKKQKCDGIYDCFDLSDECNDSCGREILHSWFLKGACWTMGVLAILLNCFGIAKGIQTVKNSNTSKTLLTNSLVCVISTGDILIGFYLVLLSVYDSLIFGENFCKEQALWLTGVACSYLGLISTIGSQLSVFAMTMLSVNRAWGVVRNNLMLPSAVSKRAVLKTILFVTLVVFASVAVAVIPLSPVFEEYFVQAMYYDPKYKVFIGFPNKARHINVLKEYFNNTVDSQSIRINMTWREIGEKVDKMFTDDYGTMGRMAVHFYGNDGVCLYKYFVLTDDARRSRQSLDGVTDITEHKGDPLLWFMLALNLFCFVCVAISYAMIYFTAKKSSEESNSCQNPAVERQNRELELKVTILVATDFLCWVPFIIISGLHNMKVIDASSWYIALSTMLLPLNSVINPLIYSKEIGNMVNKFNFMKKLISLIADRNKAADIDSTQQNPDEQAVGDIPLEEIQNGDL